MHKMVKKSEATVRKIADNKTAYNIITKDISKDVSMAIIEATNYEGDEVADYNRIYSVMEGTLILRFSDEEFTLNSADSCYVTKGESYKMIGTFKAIIISQPAFGT